MFTVTRRVISQKEISNLMPFEPSFMVPKSQPRHTAVTLLCDAAVRRGCDNVQRYSAWNFLVLSV
jgi:hypothetical protein